MSGIYLAIVAVSIVAVNVLAYGFNKRIDATKNERYTLSKGSANLVRKGLKEKLKVTLYVTRGQTKTDIFVDDLVNLMKEYETASGGKMNYVVIQPKSDKERQAAKEAGLQEAAFGEGSETGDQVNISKGYMGIVFEYGLEKEVIPILSPDNANGLEFWITNKIRLIRDKVEDSFPLIGVLKKDGIKLSDSNLVPAGRGPGPNIKALLGQHFPFYKFKDVDLGAGENEIDEELRGVR